MGESMVAEEEGEVHSLGESMVAEEEGEEGDHGHQPRQLSIHLDKKRLWTSSL